MTHYTRYTYPGNPDPLMFGEEGARGAVVATIGASGAVACDRRVVAISQVHDIALEIDGCTNSQDIRDRLAQRLHGLHGAARVTISGELANELDIVLRDLEDAAPDMDAVVFRLGEIRTAYDLDAVSAEPTVRGQFVRDVHADPALSEPERRRVVTTGDGRAFDPGRRELPSAA